MKAVTTQNFHNEVLQHNGPVLIDFWAEWCRPCIRMKPEVEALSEELQDKLKIVSINVDEEPMLAQQFRVQSIPTMVLFEKGREQNRLIGMRNRDGLKRDLNLS